MTARPHRFRRLAVAAAAGAAALVALPGVAGAHVGAASETTDGVTTVTFSFTHGCDEAPTTSLRVQLPDGATDVEPQDPPGWTSEVSGNELAWTGGSIPNGERGTFVATMVLVDPEGTTVFLPTVQGCPDGAEEAWIDRSEDPEASAAAPRITAGAVVAAPPTTHEADEKDHGSFPSGTTPEKTTNTPLGGAPTPTTAGDPGSESAAPATEAASSSSNAPLIIGVVVAIVVIGGLVAFLVTRRGSSGSSGSSTTPS
jgi:uncharacterized protein YcnI